MARYAVSVTQYPDPDYSEPQPGREFPPIPQQPLFPPPSLYPPAGQYPPHHQHPYPPLPPGINGMAVASLVTSILGVAMCFLPSMLGLVFGLVALNQIKTTGERGRGMAIAGAIIGGVVTALGAVWLVLVVVGAAAGWM